MFICGASRMSYESLTLVIQKTLISGKELRTRVQSRRVG